MFWDQFDFENEVGGFILASGEVVAADGEADQHNFTMNSQFLLKYINDAVATWHTHPAATANLSLYDWDTFVSNPDLKHFIIAVDEVRGYEVVNGSVLNTGSIVKAECTPSSFTALFGLIVQ